MPKNTETHKLPDRQLFLSDEFEEDVSLQGIPFEFATYQELETLLPVDATYEEARAFFEGDHWQEGDAWIGPMLDPADEHFDEAFSAIEQILVPHPGVEEVVNRSRDAIIANEPRWYLAPVQEIPEGEEVPQAIQELIDEAEALLTAWWDENGALETLQKVVEDVMLGGRGVCRLLVPEGELIELEDGRVLVPEGFIADQLERIHPVFVKASDGAVIRDPKTMRKAGIYFYNLVHPLTGAAQDFVEVTFLDSARRTVVRTVNVQPARNGTEVPTAVTWREDLGGNLMMFEARSRPLITRPVLQNQKLANLGCTMMGRNVVLGGFLERIFLNAQAIGHWEEDEVTGKKVFIEDPYKVGAGTTNFIEGKQIGKTQDGQPVVATPSVVFREPVRTQTFERTVAMAHMNILSAARQVHALISGDATASGESRKQARDDFLKSLTRAKSRMDALGRWLLTTTLRLGAVFAQTPTKYDSLRVVFECQLDAGPISAEDRKANLLEVSAQVKPREVAMTEIGCTDTEGWKAVIKNERAEFGIANPPGDNPATGNPPPQNNPGPAPAPANQGGDPGGGAT